MSDRLPSEFRAGRAAWRSRANAGVAAHPNAAWPRSARTRHTHCVCGRRVGQPPDAPARTSRGCLPRRGRHCFTRKILGMGPRGQAGAGGGEEGAWPHSGHSAQVRKHATRCASSSGPALGLGGPRRPTQHGASAALARGSSVPSVRGTTPPSSFPPKRTTYTNSNTRALQYVAPYYKRKLYVALFINRLQDLIFCFIKCW